MVPAPSYAPVDDLAIISCYFNPSRYASKLTNFTRFRKTIVESGLHLFIIECTFSNQAKELPTAWGAQRTSARDVMWQKERLLNVLLDRLPSQYLKVAWLDADVLFVDPEWAQKTSLALDHDAAVVQPYDVAIRLPPNSELYDGTGEMYPGFAATYADFPNCLLHGSYSLHGHTGFAWAARREVLQGSGFYDACVSGSADHAMAHAFCGDWESDCLVQTFGAQTRMLEHFQAWSERVYPLTRARVGFVPGTILHLWHGTMDNRKYYERNLNLINLGFDPYRDVIVDERGCWRWAENAGRLRAWALRYFDARHEDLAH